MSTTDVRFGGVSPRTAHKVAAAKVVPASGAAGVLPPPVAVPNFTYNGGPVIKNPHVFASFWGSLWSDQTHTTRSGRLVQFLQDLLQSQFMNLLSEYGVGHGAGSAGTFGGSSFLSSVSSTLTDSAIQTNIQSLIDNKQLPEPVNLANVAVIVYLDENTGVKDPSAQTMCEATSDTAFGYHSVFTTKAGNPMYYAVVPGLSDTCLKQTCPGPGGDTGCSLHLAQTQEQRLTQVTSHEFAEMTSDPALDGWTAPNTNENGDICNGQSATITVSGRTWTIQNIYSYADDVQNQSTAVPCVGSATSTRSPISSPLQLDVKSLIQSDFKSGSHGNFELVVEKGRFLVHHFHDNSNVNLLWRHGQVITSSATGPACIIQSNFKSGSHGNFEVVVVEGNNLVHYFHDNSNVNLPWRKAQTIATGVTGPASMIQSDFKSSDHGNFELVVPIGGNLVHFFHDNSNVNLPWRQSPNDHFGRDQALPA